MCPAGLPTPSPWRFGVFEFDPSTSELRRDGSRIALGDQPTRVLLLLLACAGELVTRADLQHSLWSGRTFIEDFDQGLNAAVKRLRDALGDHANEPTFIETVPRRGYRFIGPVRIRERAVPPARGADRSSTSHDAKDGPPLRRLIVLPFRLLRPDPEIECLAFGIADAVAASLASVEGLVVRSSLAAARYASTVPDVRALAAEAEVELVVSGTVLRAGDAIRVTAQIAEAPAGTLLWSHTHHAGAGELFQVQDHVAGCVRRTIGAPLPRARRARPCVP